MRDDLHERLLGCPGGKLPPEVLDTWIRPLRVLEVSETRVELIVPDNFFRQQLEQRYLEPLRAAVSHRRRARGPSSSSRSTARPPSRRPGAAAPRRPPAQPALHLRDLRRRPLQPVRPRRLPGGRREARRGLQPPLHLRRRRPRQDPPAPRHRPPLPAHPHVKIHYLSTEKFTNDLIHAIRGEDPEFRQRYRTSTCS